MAYENAHLLLLTVDQLEPLSHGITQNHRQLTQVAHDHVIRERKHVQVGLHHDLVPIRCEQRHSDVHDGVLPNEIEDVPFKPQVCIRKQYAYNLPYFPDCQ